MIAVYPLHPQNHIRQADHWKIWWPVTPSCSFSVTAC